MSAGYCDRKNFKLQSIVKLLLINGDRELEIKTCHIDIAINISN